MASNNKSDTYDDNSTCQKSTQIIEVNEPNIINTINPNKENFNNNTTKLTLNSKNNKTNIKNNAIYKSVDILPSNKISNNIINNKEYPYYNNLPVINQKAYTERNTDDLTIKNQKLEKNIEQTQKEIINIEKQSSNNNERYKEENKCCKCCKDKCERCCEFCKEKKCKIIWIVILGIIAVIVCIIFFPCVGACLANDVNVFDGIRHCDCDVNCDCKCCCCKKKRYEINWN